jgi:hypothetical protein
MHNYNYERISTVKNSVVTEVLNFNKQHIFVKHSSRANLRFAFQKPHFLMRFFYLITYIIKPGFRLLNIILMSLMLKFITRMRKSFHGLMVGLV